MNMKIKGVDYDDGLVAGVTISGVFDTDKDEPVTAYFRRQVYGKWINEVEKHPDLYGWVPLDSVVCSICNMSNNIKTDYCPHCGAIMLLED